MQIKTAARHTWVQISPVPLAIVHLCIKRNPGPPLHPLPSKEDNLPPGVVRIKLQCHGKHLAHTARGEC